MDRPRVTSRIPAANQNPPEIRASVGPENRMKPGPVGVREDSWGSGAVLREDAWAKMEVDLGSIFQ